MITERQRNQAVSCKPAPDAAENQPVLQFNTRHAAGECNRIVAVGAMQRPQPAGRVKDASLRVAFYKTLPAIVAERI